MPNWKDFEQLIEKINKKYEEQELDSVIATIRADILMCMFKRNSYIEHCGNGIISYLDEENNWKELEKVSNIAIFVEYQNVYDKDDREKYIPIKPCILKEKDKWERK